MEASRTGKHYIGEVKVKIRIFGILAAITVTNMTVALAGDPAAATQKAQTVCAGCHGRDGISTNPIWPNLAGQKEQYLAKAITDYRDGNRSDPNMGAISQSLSDKEIEDLAAYFSRLPANATP